MVSFSVLVAHANSIPKNLIKPLVPSESYTHKIDVDEDIIGLYTLFWKLTSDDEILFEIHAKTTGWIGVGVSPNGGMAGISCLFLL